MDGDVKMADDNEIKEIIEKLKKIAKEYEKRRDWEWAENALKELGLSFWKSDPSGLHYTYDVGNTFDDLETKIIVIVTSGNKIEIYKRVEVDKNGEA